MRYVLILGRIRCYLRFFVYTPNLCRAFIVSYGDTMVLEFVLAERVTFHLDAAITALVLCLANSAQSIVFLTAKKAPELASTYIVRPV